MSVQSESTSGSAPDGTAGQATVAPPSPPSAAAPNERLAWGIHLAGWAAFAAALSVRKLGDFDLPWHLATGRAIVEARGIPAVDPLAYTHAPLTYVEALADTALYALHALGGAPLLQVAGGIAGASLGLTVASQARRFGALAWGAAGLAAAGCYGWLVVRPATASFVLLAVLLLLLDVHRRAPVGPGARRVLVGLPLLALVWANVHGFVTIAAGVTLSYAAYRLACRLVGGRLGGLLPVDDGRGAGPMLLSALATAVASAATVKGFVLRFALPRTVASAAEVAASDANTEFVAPTLAFFRDHEPLAVVVGLLVLVALAFGREPSGRRTPPVWELGCVAVGFGLFSWMVRTVPLGVIVMIPVVVRRLGHVVPRTPVATYGLAVGSWFAAAYALAFIDTRVGFGFEDRHLPERAVQWIEARRAEGRGPTGHVYNFSPFGGYLEWRLGPGEALLDGRTTHARGGDLVDRGARALFDAAAFEELTRDFDLQYAVVSSREGERFDEPLAASQSWKMVYMDDVAAVYVRRGGVNEGLEREGYRVFRHLVDPGAVLAAAREGGARAPALRHDGALAASQDPASSRAAFFEACGAIAVRDAQGLERAALRLHSLSPGHAAIGALLAPVPRVGSGPLPSSSAPVPPPTP